MPPTSRATATTPTPHQSHAHMPLSSTPGPTIPTSTTSLPCQHTTLRPTHLLPIPSCVPFAPQQPPQPLAHLQPAHQHILPCHLPCSPTRYVYIRHTPASATHCPVAPAPRNHHHHTVPATTTTTLRRAATTSSLATTRRTHGAIIGRRHHVPSYANACPGHPPGSRGASYLKTLPPTSPLTTPRLVPEKKDTRRVNTAGHPEFSPASLPDTTHTQPSSSGRTNDVVPV